jgi:hypothetical protein
MKKIKFITLSRSRSRLKGVNGNIYKANSKRLGWWGNRRQAREGQALIPMVLFILMGIMLLGVILEAGNLFIARRHLQNDADAAATWGAMQLDISGLRVSNGDKVHIISPGDNPATADRAGLKIIEFMTMAGYRSDEWDWQWGRCTMQIDIKRKVPMVFGSIFGVREATVSVSAKARLNNTDQKITCG